MIAVPEKGIHCHIFTNNVKADLIKGYKIIMGNLYNKIICPMNVSSFLQTTKPEPNKLIAQHYKLMTTGYIMNKYLLRARVFDDVFKSCLSCFICFRHSQYSFFESEFFLLYYTDTQYIFCNIFKLIFVCIYIHT